MKTVILWIVFVCGGSVLFGQDKKDLSISLSTGIFNSPYYTNDKGRFFYALDFGYQLSRRHNISTNFTAGKHQYFDDVHSNNAVPITTPGYEQNRNGLAEYIIFSILYKYHFISGKRWSLNAGAGAGIMTQTVEFPYTEGNMVDFRQSSWTDIAFPVRLDIDYHLSRLFKIGVTGGFYVHPDYPVLGLHIGPRISYVVK